VQGNGADLNLAGLRSRNRLVAESSANQKRALSSALSGGLKSLWRSNEGRHIQEAGFVASLAGESGRYGERLNVSSRQGWKSSGVEVPVPSIVCITE
jgi:hypothetical protein